MRRREFIIGTASGAIAATAAGAKEFPAKPRGPDHFLWGTAGAAYQIEGGNVASDLWVLEHVEPTLFPTPSGDACDTYNRFGEDLALSASLGFNAHRFSIEWSRIEPERGQISKAGLAYYRRVLEACQTHGLAPAVTLSHVSVPRWIAASGGFANPINVAAFAAHCGRIARAMGDLISLAATFNEPNAWTLALWGGYIDQQLATIKAMQSAAAAVTSSPNWASPMVSGLGQYDGIVAAHTAAITAIRDAGGTFPIGFALAVMADHAAKARLSASNPTCWTAGWRRRAISLVCKPIPASPLGLWAINRRQLALNLHRCIIPFCPRPPRWRSGSLRSGLPSRSTLQKMASAPKMTAAK
ncbi:MAG: hypothetical protein JWO15_3504 [Sphingomonadales bacterium]|nr:hypothetical protein [Sphingomonadales bacterium]